MKTNQNTGKVIIGIVALLIALVTGHDARCGAANAQSAGAAIVFCQSTNFPSGPSYDTRIEILTNGYIMVTMRIWHNTALRGYTTNQRILLRDGAGNFKYALGPFRYGLGPKHVPFSAPDNRIEVEVFQLPSSVPPNSIASMEVLYWTGGSKDTEGEIFNKSIELLKAVNTETKISVLKSGGNQPE